MSAEADIRGIDPARSHLACTGAHSRAMSLSRLICDSRPVKIY